MASANLVIDEGTSVLVSSGEEIIDLLRGGQGVLNIVPMSKVVSEVDSAILELGLSRKQATEPDRPASDGAARDSTLTPLGAAAGT